MIYDKLYQDIIAKVSEETGISKEVILVAYRSQWEFIRTHIEELDLKGVKSEEEFDKLRVSFNIPSIGKLYTTWDKIQAIRRRINYLNNLKEKNESKEN